jgi:signal transduction histidine kinase
MSMASAKRDIPIEAYPQAIRRCLANLVDNARRYAGGAISLRIERHAGKIMMHVDDDDPGIPPSERERVFEPYVRLDPSGGSQTGAAASGWPSPARLPALMAAIYPSRTGQAAACGQA